MVGLAMLLYSNEHGGQYPACFEDLILQGELTPNFLCCPRTNDTQATGPTTQAVAANLASGGHLSYVYAARGFSASASAETVLAYEPLANHGDGANILWGDGSVEFVDAIKAQKIISQVESGTNPPK
jgi:prepilin-type processing-associated H-X9-DG protein